MSSEKETASKINIPTVEELLLAGAHFGHQTKRWDPAMAPYIYKNQQGIHIIDLYQTHKLLQEAVAFLRQVAAAGGQVIFVGTKGQAKEIIAERAGAAGALYVTERWLGGTLTNFKELTKRLNYLKDYYKKVETNGYKDFTKKERLLFSREADKMQKVLGGILSLKGLPAAVVIVDPHRERIALRECVRVGVPVVALTDTNCNPRGINYIIPTNDDAVKAVDLIVSALAAAVAVESVKTEEVRREVTPGAGPVKSDLVSLGLSNRSLNALSKAKINTVAALKKTDLAAVKGLGAKSVEEIRKAIHG